jgi:hypothetical protein
MTALSRVVERGLTLNNSLSASLIRPSEVARIVLSILLTDVLTLTVQVSRNGSLYV